MPSPRISKQYQGETVFLTLSVIEWINIFCSKKYFYVLLSSLSYCQKTKGLIVFGFVFMTNHIHLIVASREMNLYQIIRDFKSFTTNEIKKLLLCDRRKYILWLIKNSFSKKESNLFQVWQRENYPEIIKSDKFFYQKLRYIHYNPVKKGYVVKPEDWLYSSAKYWYEQQNVGLKISSF